MDKKNNYENTKEINKKNGNLVQKKEDVKEREMALNILLEVQKDGGYNNILLNKALSLNSKLTKTQKSFVTELVNGTLRNLIKIDFIIDLFSKTKTQKQKPLILNLLRLGVYQIIFLDKTPDSAACNEAVNLAKKRGFQSLSGFVNGVLRSVIRNKENIDYPKINDFSNYCCVMFSMPLWLINYWLKDHSNEEVLKICENSNKIPKVTICINSIKTSKEALIKMLENDGVEVEESETLENALHLKKTSDIRKLTSYKEGLFHVMDEGAMLAVNALDVKSGESVMDMCAAPGGKSFYMAYLMNDEGKISSYDVHEHKISLLDDGVNRLGLNSIETQINDATKLMKIKTNKTHKVDKILLDVPCSGFGLLRKKPDIKYGKTLEDVRELAIVQAKILETCSRYLKPNGELVYSTCTISQQENKEIVENFAKENNYEIMDISKFTNKFENVIVKNNLVELLPSENNDGFFVAKLRKR